MDTNNSRQEFLEDIGEGVGYAKAYVEQRLHLIQLKYIEKGAKVGSSLISGLLIGLFSAFIIGFGSIALALYLGQLLASNALGFLIVTGIFTLLLIGLILFRKSFITNPLIALLINELRD